MNFALTDEQEFLAEAARGALSRVRTVEGAREALDGGELPDLWPTAREAGWPGLLVAEEHGGAGLGAMDAMLVFEELGRVLASVPLLGHVPASFLLDRAGHGDLDALATGERRAALVTGDGRFTPDAPGADVLVLVDAEGRASVLDSPGVEPVVRYDATRSLGHAPASGGSPLEVPVETARAAFHLQQCLLAAECLGAVETCLQTSVEYAKERFTFGRPIGSYQAIKHQLVEVLRRRENARSLMYYAGWAGSDRPTEFPLAAAAFRHVAGEALDYASRAMISVHGGIGATWEHDAPLYFRRAQLTRRLLGGNGGAAGRVADELFAQVAPAGAG